MADAISETVTATTRRTGLATFVKRLVKEKPLGTVGAAITLILLFVAIFPGLIAPYGMNEDWAGEFLEPPSGSYWFGTDNLGRDIFSRVVYGARISVIIGLSPLPTRLGHAGNFPFQRKLSQTNSTQGELSVIAARPPAHLAPVVRAHLEFRCALCLDPQRRFSHRYTLSSKAPSTH